MGCEGGDTCFLLEWLVDKKIKIELDNEYPLAWRTQTCKLKEYVYIDVYLFQILNYTESTETSPMV